MIRGPVAVKTASKASVYLASRSLIRNFKPSVRSSQSMSVFRACCTVLWGAKTRPRALSWLLGGSLVLDEEAASQALAE